MNLKRGEEEECSRKEEGQASWVMIGGYVK